MPKSSACVHRVCSCGTLAQNNNYIFTSQAASDCFWAGYDSANCRDVRATHNAWHGYYTSNWRAELVFISLRWKWFISWKCICKFVAEQASVAVALCTCIQDLSRLLDIASFLVIFLNLWNWMQGRYTESANAFFAIRIHTPSSPDSIWKGIVKEPKNQSI